MIAARRSVPAALAVLALAGCGAGSEKAASPQDAAAGTWKTWVLENAGEVSAPAPAEGAAKAAKVAKADTRPAVEPWLQTAMELVSRRPKDPVTASRNYALVAVAMYDAAVAASHWQSRYDSASYPSTTAAIAGAGSRVMAYAFPEYPPAQLDVDAEAQAKQEVASGVASRPAADAGLRLGRQVAERVIAYGRRDGSTRKWDGSRPRGPQYYRPPPGSAARPVAPVAGTWKTWVIESGTAVRPPAPPMLGSEQFRREAEEVKRIGDNLTSEQARIAEFWAGGDGTELPPGRWLKVALGYLRQQPAMSDVRYARLFALLSVGMADAGVAAWDSKFKWWTPRPETAIRDLGLARDWKPLLDTPFFPAYVSGHAAYSGAAADVLGYLFPKDDALWHRRAREAAMSRLYGGIHYRSDSDAGLVMGAEIGKLVVARAERDGADR